jgi:hypothetical protein
MEMGDENELGEKCILYKLEKYKYTYLRSLILRMKGEGATAH